jgi:hypothetical protein
VPTDAQPAPDICRKLIAIGWVLFFVACVVAFVPFAGFLLGALGVGGCVGLAVYVMIKKGGARGVVLLIVSLLIGIPMCFIGSCVGTAVGVVGGAVSTMTTVIGTGIALDGQSPASGAGGGHAPVGAAGGGATQAPAPRKPEPPPKIAPAGGLPATVEDAAPESERRNIIAPAEALPDANALSGSRAGSGAANAAIAPDAPVASLPAAPAGASSAPGRGAIAPAEPLPEQ